MRKRSKSKACLREVEADGTTLQTDLGEMRAAHVANELADDPEAEAVGEQHEDSVLAELNEPPAEPSTVQPARLNEPPAEPSIGQPADPGAEQEAIAANAFVSTPSVGACKSGQLLSRSLLIDDDKFGSCSCVSQLPVPDLHYTVRKKLRETPSHLMMTIWVIHVQDQQQSSALMCTAWLNLPFWLLKRYQMLTQLIKQLLRKLPQRLM